MYHPSALAASHRFRALPSFDVAYSVVVDRQCDRIGR
jgi:hypothetical protein